MRMLRFGQQELRAEMPGLTAHGFGKRMAFGLFHAGIIHHFGSDRYLPPEGVLFHDKHPVPGAGKVEGGGQPGRAPGHNCPSSTAQLAVAKVVDETSDLSVYETNMNLLYDALTRLGFDVVRPGGTFYIFPKALEEDANAFCMKAKEYDLILVPSDSFGVPGYFRMAYCIDTEKVKRSIPVFEKFAHEVYGL